MTCARKLILLSLGAALGACSGGGGGGGEAQGGNVAANVAEPGNRAGSAGGGTGAQGQTIAAAAAATPELSSFVRAVESAGLTETLRGAGPYTVFAPSNEAFTTPPGQDRAQLIALLSRHIVPGTVTAQDLRRAAERGEGGRAELATVSGDNLSIRREGEAIMVGNGAGTEGRITAADQIVANGVIHRIDRVIAPAAAGAQPAAGTQQPAQ